MPRRGLSVLIMLAVSPLFACGTDDGEDSGVHDSGNNGDSGYCECYGYDTCCDGICVDPRTDQQNCGECNNVCPPHEYCHQTSCVARCSDREDFCDELCIDTSYDEDHCGECNNPCEHAQMCMIGVCTDVEPQE